MQVTTRSKVIEKAVKFEELVSILLSFLLDIKKEESRSFGSKSSALGFNQKINLLIDLNFVPKDIEADFQLFAEIRNKFAHLHNVDSFSKCFEVISQKENKFKSFGSKLDEISLGREGYFDVCFNILCFQLEIWLRVASETIRKKKKEDFDKTGAVEILRTFLESKRLQEPAVLNQFLETIEPIVNNIDVDKDLMEEIENQRQQALNNKIE